MKNLWHGQTPHEDDFYLFKALSKSTRPIRMLDCGANSGQSAISFLMNCPNGHVVSFEPNLIYQPVLEGIRSLLGADRFEFHMEGLSDEECDLDLYIPHIDGVPYLQEATLDLSQFDKPWVAERLKSYGEKLSIILSRAHFSVADSKNLNVDIIKIDVEGAEMRVLRGMRNTITEYKPIFLIENNDWEAVTKFLSVFGYRPYQWKSDICQIVEMNGASTNCFYFIKEHFDNYRLALSQPNEFYRHCHGTGVDII